MSSERNNTPEFKELLEHKNSYVTLYRDLLVLTNSLSTEVPKLKYNQEEGNTRLVLHTAYRTRHTKCLCGK